MCGRHRTVWPWCVGRRVPLRPASAVAACLHPASLLLWIAHPPAAQAIFIGHHDAIPTHRTSRCHTEHWHAHDVERLLGCCCLLVCCSEWATQAWHVPRNPSARIVSVEPRATGRPVDCVILSCIAASLPAAGPPPPVCPGHHVHREDRFNNLIRSGAAWPINPTVLRRHLVHRYRRRRLRQAQTAPRRRAERAGNDFEFDGG